LIVVPSVQLSPDPGFHGITGMQTRFWYQGQDRVEATASVRGYSVTVWAEPDGFWWDTGDARPNRVVSSASPGSRDHPAATWVYETKGHYEITHQVRWTGGWSYEFAPPGLSPISSAGRLPSIFVTNRIDYQVDEIRSAITAGT
jgi:hypothetical protein